MNLNKKSIGGKAGFTLVELIVVIAILGIMAGVAVPAYSGYVEKAKQGADDAVIMAASTAFTTALYEKGMTPSEANGAVLQFTKGGAVTGVKIGSNDFPEFMKYYDGAATIQYYEEGTVKYIAADGIFKPMTESRFRPMSDPNKDAYNGSSYAKIGTTALTGRVDDLVTNLSDGENEDALFTLVTGADENFRKFLVETGAFDEFVDEVTGEFDIYAFSGAYYTGDANAENLQRKVANASVLFVSDVMEKQGVTENELVEGLANNTLGSLLGGVDAASYKFMESALQYSLMMAYFENPDNNDTWFSGASDAATSYDDFRNLWAEAKTKDGFNTYLGTAAATKDAAGFLAVMETIKDNKDLMDWSAMGSGGDFYSSLTGDINLMLK